LLLYLFSSVFAEAITIPLFSFVLISIWRCVDCENAKYTLAKTRELNIPNFTRTHKVHTVLLQVAIRRATTLLGSMFNNTKRQV
jgi:hypothetical protein